VVPPPPLLSPFGVGVGDGVELPGVGVGSGVCVEGLDGAPGVDPELVPGFWS
jgi:hypothetical protein